MPRNFPNTLDAYLKFLGESEAPYVYRKWTGISLIAGLLQRKCWSNWETEIYPNLYCVLVGPSAARKGTAMFAARRILRDLGIHLTAESTTREALIEHMRDSAGQYQDPSFPDIPIFHNSLTVCAPELAVFLGINNPEFLSALTDWFDCPDPWTYRTRSKGIEEITKVYVNLIGATTPELIKNTLPQDAIGGGLTSRIIFVFARGAEKLIPFPVNPFSNEPFYEALKSDFTHIQALSGEFQITDEYKKHYERWYLDSEKNPPFEDIPNLEPYLGRRALHLRKLSMIMSAARTDDMVIEAEDFDSALEYLSEAERSMPSVFVAYGRLDTTVILQRVMNTIRKRRKIWYSELAGIFINDLTQDELQQALGVLYDMGFCELKKKMFKADDGGQKEKTEVIYNPEFEVTG